MRSIHPGLVQSSQLTLISEHCPTASWNGGGITSERVFGVELGSVNSIIVGLISPSENVESVSVLLESGLVQLVTVRGACGSKQWISYRYIQGGKDARSSRCLYKKNLDQIILNKTADYGHGTH